MIKNTLIIILFLSIHTDWVTDAEKLINMIDENGVLEKELKVNEEMGSVTLSSFKYKNIHRLTNDYLYENFLDIQSNYYLKNDSLFAFITTGKDVLIYKREKKPEDPNSVLVESRTYFKNKKEGLRKKRKIYVYKKDDIDKLKIELKKKDFETETLDHEDYQNILEDYLRIKKEIEKS